MIQSRLSAFSPSRRRGTRALLLAGALAGAAACPTRAQKIEVLEERLENGLTLLLVPRHDEPSVAGGWVAHVGSANERPGITGIAHLFEHMMFKGTPTIGTTNYTRDLAIMDEQERIRGAMRAEEAARRQAWRRGDLDDPLGPADHSPRLRELEAAFARLVQEQRAVLVKNEFDRIYRGAGGSGMNAYTTQDATAYFVTVPANKLELFMWMESERLLHPVFREFYAERNVVLEERRMRTEATPLGKYEESLNAMFWEAHPYQWPVIGWPSDLMAISKADADAFYAAGYAPQNITLILVGDFDPAAARALVARYFGRIPRGERPLPDVVTLELPGVAEKRLNAAVDANSQVNIMWKSVPAGHRDGYALRVLGQLLDTRTGRLHKALVRERNLATDCYAMQRGMRWAGVFYAGGEAAAGHTPEEVEAGIYREVERLQQEEAPADELLKVKNNFAANEYRKLTSNGSILMQLLRSEGSGNWREFQEGGAKIQAVTAADVRRVATRYLTRENRTVGLFTRNAAVTAGTPSHD